MVGAGPFFIMLWRTIKMVQIKKRAKALGIPLLCGLLIFLLFRFVLIIGYVPSASMEPAIQSGSYILGLRTHGELQRGDIVVFHLEGRMLVKRIAGVPGDSVYVQETEINVPDGCYYLLGDNPAESRDSRYWEDPFIHERDILARLFIP
jgi:signal peptidase I